MFMILKWFVFFRALICLILPSLTVRGKRASPKKPRKKREVFDSSESETESDEDFLISKGIDSAPFKDGEGKYAPLVSIMRLSLYFS